MFTAISFHAVTALPGGPPLAGADAVPSTATTATAPTTILLPCIAAPSTVRACGIHRGCGSLAFPCLLVARGGDADRRVSQHRGAAGAWSRSGDTVFLRITQHKGPE